MATYVSSDSIELVRMLYCGISVSFNPFQLFDLNTANDLAPVLIHHVLLINKKI